MNLVSVTILAFAAAVEARLSTPHGLFGAAQLSFLEEPCEGCAPDYCYPISEPADYDCYKAGYPKCCTKSKGNCPNDVKNKPGCECLPGVCGNSNSGTGRSTRCVTGDGTCKGDTFCEAKLGFCGDAVGRCEKMPSRCGKSTRPVCGCNGATYDNLCEASAHGVSIASAHACDSAPVDPDDCTLDGNECGSDKFCAVDAGQCKLKMAGTPGKCQPFRPMCNLSLNPVCGCDGETYGNADCANAQGVNVADEGACARTSCTYNGVDDDTCSGDFQFCRLGVGDCTKRIASQSGYCGTRPIRCSYDFKPVCGCDSNTYANECVARFEGVNVMHDDAC